jgi:hypothetical protein
LEDVYSKEQTFGLRRDLKPTGPHSARIVDENIEGPPSFSRTSLSVDGEGKMLGKPFVATLLPIILIVTPGDGKTATQERYEAVTHDVRRAIDGIRHQLPKPVDEVTTLTDAYIDPNDDRKAVFVSTLSVAKNDIDQKKWQDLGQKLRR